MNNFLIQIMNVIDKCTIMIQSIAIGIFFEENVAWKAAVKKLVFFIYFILEFLLGRQLVFHHNT